TADEIDKIDDPRSRHLGIEVVARWSGLGDVRDGRIEQTRCFGERCASYCRVAGVFGIGSRDEPQEGDEYRCVSSAEEHRMSLPRLVPEMACRSAAGSPRVRGGRRSWFADSSSSYEARFDRRFDWAPNSTGPTRLRRAAIAIGLRRFVQARRFAARAAD